MKRLFSVVFLAAAVACTSISAASSTANEVSVECPVEKICTGFAYQCKYVEKRVGLFGCRTRCVPCWVKVPIYGYVSKPIIIHGTRPETNGIQVQPGPGENRGANIRGESGAEVTTGL